MMKPCQVRPFAWLLGSLVFGIVSHTVTWNFLSPWASINLPEVFLAAYTLVLLGSIYITIWLASRKIELFKALLSLLCSFPVKTTVNCTALGLLIPTLAIAISWLMGEYSFRDTGLLESLLLRQLHDFPNTFAMALFEEVLDRGIILFFLLQLTTRFRFGTALAVVLSAVIFAIGHSDATWRDFFRIMTFGSLTAVLCIRYRSIFPGAGMHAAANVAMHMYLGSTQTGGILLHRNGPHLTVDTLAYFVLFCWFTRSLIHRKTASS